MNILHIALKKEGGIAELALSCNVSESTVKGWRNRGVPNAWQKFFELRYARQIKLALADDVAKDAN
jgi:hypothetical protein